LVDFSEIGPVPDYRAEMPAVDTAPEMVRIRNIGHP
jgi:hypothetical protein